MDLTEAAAQVSQIHTNNGQITLYDHLSFAQVTKGHQTEIGDIYLAYTLNKPIMEDGEGPVSGCIKLQPRGGGYVQASGAIWGDFMMWMIIKTLCQGKKQYLPPGAHFNEITIGFDAMPGQIGSHTFVNVPEDKQHVLELEVIINQLEGWMNNAESHYLEYLAAIS
ncbi:hypothetical protein D3C78_19530 [compost metagenome]